MNVEKDLVMVCFSKEFLNAEEKYYTNSMDSEAAPVEMF
jgi:hypothetical protein